jgi:hypothetical protein
MRESPSSAGTLPKRPVLWSEPVSGQADGEPALSRIDMRQLTDVCCRDSHQHGSAAQVNVTS